MDTRHFYLCPPTYFEISAKINKWMDPENKPADRELAQQQWDQLLEIYQRLDLKTTLLDPIDGLPDLVFPGDSIFLCGNKAIGGRFRHAQRQPEVEPKLNWFEARGFNISRVPEGIYFEGNAEAVRWNDILLGGYGVRTDRAAYDFLEPILGIDIVPLRIQSPYFHLDVAILPLNKDVIAYVPEAFDAESREIIHSFGADLIEVDEDEAQLLACNAIVVDENVVIGTTNAPKLTSQLKKRGFNPISLDLTEFRKSGGSVKCLTLERYIPAKTQINCHQDFVANYVAGD